ncbi:MAG: choice-of-anchor B family protein [Bacteroidota bacterium]|nr:choice-of-anchor B family protein [Bacteroidota bacterium]
MKNVLIFLSLLFSLYLQAQDGDLNMKIVANVPAPSPDGGSGIWHYVDKNGIEYAAIGLKSALVIYSLEDPKNPVERARVNGVNTTWREVFAYKDYIYAVTDSRSDGLVIVNMKGAPNNITSKFWRSTITANNQTAELDQCHTIFVDEKGILCLNGCKPWNGVLFFDINTYPENPQFIGSQTKRYCHDMYMRNDTLWSSDITSGLLSIWNCKDKMNPIEITTITTPFAFTHNAWISDDSKYVFTTDERDNAYVASYDVSNLPQTKLLDVYRPKDTEGRGVIPHNTRYLNGFLITSYYTDGVKITDVHRPDNMVEVGSVDTYAGPDGGFHGCWGVSPYLPSGTIVASDIEGGLFVIEADYIRACYLEGLVQDSLTDEPIKGATVIIQASRKNQRESNLTGDYKTGYPIAGEYDVTFSHPDYLTRTVKASLNHGIVTIKNVKLLAKSTITFRIIVKEKGTLKPIENAQISASTTNRRFSTSTNNLGESMLRVHTDSFVYDLVVGKWGFKHIGLKFDSQNPPANPITVLLSKGYMDDFIFDLGWTVNSTASTGAWVRAEPVGTMSRGSVVQTDSDLPNDFGIECYITGNGSTDPATDDLDNGSTVLTSPDMDLSSYNDPVLSYYRWFANTGGSGNPNDKMVLRITNGVQTLSLEEILSPDTTWKKSDEFHLKTLITVTNSMKFSVDIADDAPGHLVEGALDGFLVFDAQPTGTINNTKAYSLEALPNLFTEETTIKYVCPNSCYIRISDLTGKNISYSPILENQGQILLGKELDKGMYILNLIVGNQTLGSIKLIKQ